MGSLANGILRWLAFPSIFSRLPYSAWRRRRVSKRQTAAAAAKVVDAAPVVAGRGANDLALQLDRKAEGYPVVLVSYSIACSQYADAATGAAVKGYLSYITSDAGQQAAVATAGNAPLAGALATKVAAAVAAIK